MKKQQNYLRFMKPCGDTEDMENWENPSKNVLLKQIGSKIAYYRSLRGLTQIDLAVLVNVSRSTIGRIERGQYNENLSIATLLDIANGLQVNINSLINIPNDDIRLIKDKSNKK